MRADSNGHVFYQYFENRLGKRCATSVKCKAHLQTGTYPGWKSFRHKAIWPQVGNPGSKCVKDAASYIVASQKKCQDDAEAAGVGYYMFKMNEKRCAICSTGIDYQNGAPFGASTQWHVFKHQPPMVPCAAPHASQQLDMFLYCCQQAGQCCHSWCQPSNAGQCTDPDFPVETWSQGQHSTIGSSGFVQTESHDVCCASDWRPLNNHCEIQAENEVWVIGAAGDSCETVCEARMSTCDQSRLDALNGQPLSVFADKYLLAGLECKDNTVRDSCVTAFEGNNCVSWGSPYIHQNHLEGRECQGGSAPSVAPCGQRPVDRNHQRLCPC